MKNKILYHYLAVSKLIDKRLSIQGARLYRELLTLCLDRKRLTYIIDYDFLEKKIGCDNNITKKFLEEIENCALISTAPCSEKINVIISIKENIFDNDFSKDQLIGKAIPC